MFKEYIRKNKALFLFGSLGVIEIGLVISIFVLSYLLRDYYHNIKEEESIREALKNTEWDFWGVLWNSGKSMSIYSNISRLEGYKDSLFPTFISNLFKGEEVENIVNSQNLINLFWRFNLLLQCIVALVSISGTLLCIWLLLLGWHIYNYFLLAQPWNFKKLAIVSIFNLIGFYISYYIETYKSPNLNISEKIANIGFVNTIRKLRYKTYKLNLSSTKDNEVFLEVKDFSYAHNLNSSWWNKTEVIYNLKDVNLKIKKGSFNVIIGPNGSGKTTLLKALINLNKKQKGEILWNGVALDSINPTEFSRQVSYIPQFLNLQNTIPVLDFLEYARYPYRQVIGNTEELDKELVEEAIERNNCEKLRDRMLDELSGGQRQKIVLTSVLVQESEVIVLDEPTSFLDIKNQHQFLELLSEFNKKGKTIIMILHDIRQSIKYADNLIVMYEGRVRAVGHPSEIVTKELLEEVFRVSCDIEREGEEIYLNNVYAL